MLDGKEAVKNLFTKASHFHYTGIFTLELDYSRLYSLQYDLHARSSPKAEMETALTPAQFCRYDLFRSLPAHTKNRMMMTAIQCP